MSEIRSAWNRRWITIFLWGRRVMVAGLCGVVMTVIVAWGCAMWSPVNMSVDPMADPVPARERSDPEGEYGRGLYWEATGFGYDYFFHRGERTQSAGKPDTFIWGPPYGGTYHRVAGWPFFAMWSRVSVVDSSSHGAVLDGEPEPSAYTPRHRWDLPRDEIVHRGVGSLDFPAWMHVQAERRLPLVPLGWGFAGDVVFYGVGVLMLGAGWRRLRGRWQQRRRGFPVVVKESTHIHI